MKERKEFKKLPCFKILVFKDGKEYVAHILEMDIVGTGNTRDEAIAEAGESATAQIRYAIDHDRVDEILNPAPEEFFRKWEEAGQKLTMQFFYTLVERRNPSRSRKYEALEIPVESLCPVS